MLSSLFLGNDAALKTLQLQFLPLERSSWERLNARGLFTAAARHDGVADTVHPLFMSRRRVGDHPLMHEFAQGLSTRDVVKAILILLFPLTYEECCRRAATTGGRSITSSDRPGPSKTTSMRKAALLEGGVCPSSSQTPHRPSRRPSVAAKDAATISRKDDKIATAIRTSEVATNRVRLDDIIPLDEVSGVLSLDVPQLLCYVLLPLSYTMRHPDGDDDLEHLPTDVSMEFFRAARSLCEWTRWVSLRLKSNRVVVLEDMDSFFLTQIVCRARLMRPLMFSIPTKEKAMRFLELRDLGPQSVVAFMHMLSVFLTDTFELAFTKAAVHKLRQSVSTADAAGFLQTLDIWRYEDGWEHAKRLLAVFPTTEALQRASSEDIVRASGLLLPTDAHKMHLQRTIESQPRRSIAATSHVLLHAAVPLGSVAEERRASRRRTAESAGIVGADRTSPSVKLGLFELSITSHRFDDVLNELLHDPSLTESEDSCAKAAADVWSRVAVSMSGPMSGPSVEDILIERLLESAACLSVASTLASSAVARHALQRQNLQRWKTERTERHDLRPMTTDPLAKTTTISVAEASQDARAHLYDRNVRALERAKRKQTSSMPHLHVPLPHVNGVWRRGTEDAAPAVAPQDVPEAPVAPPSAAGEDEGRRRRWRLDPDTELTTPLPPPISGLTKKQVFECFYNGPATLRQFPYR